MTAIRLGHGFGCVGFLLWVGTGTVPNQPIQLRLDVENESVLSLYVDGVPLLPKVRGSVGVVVVGGVVVCV